jgi:predicted dehydrogenase
MKTRWGILSTANIGVSKVIPAIQKASNCEVVAIASRSLKNATEVAHKLGIQKAYGSYEELLNDKNIDVIYNPLPNNLHVLYTIQACKAGKHVLCEKPIALTARDAYYLKSKLFNSPQFYIMEAFMYKFHPQWIKAKQLVDEGAIGEVKIVHSFFSYFNTDPVNIRNQVKIGGGALMDIGCYCISFPRYIFGQEPVRAISYVDRDVEMKIDRVTSGMLDFGKGLSASFTCSTQLSPFQRTQIIGTKGRIEIEIPVNAPNDRETRIFLFTEGKSEEFVFPVCDQYTLQAEQFSAAILDNQPIPVSLNDAILNMDVIDALFESEKKGAWARVKYL